MGERASCRARAVWIAALLAGLGALGGLGSGAASRPATQPRGIVPTQPAPTRPADWAKIIPPEGLSGEEYARIARQTLVSLLAVKGLRWHQVPTWADPGGEIFREAARLAPPYAMPNAGVYPGGGLMWVEVGSDGRFHAQWYPSGRPMVVEEFDRDRIISARYYGADGNLLARVEGGAGTRLAMDLAPGRIGAIKVRGDYLNGLMHGTITVYSPDGDPNGRTCRYRQGSPVEGDESQFTQYCWDFYPPSYYLQVGGRGEKELEAAGRKHLDMPPAIALAIEEHPELAAPYKEFAAEKGFVPGGIVAMEAGSPNLALVWGTFRTPSPQKGMHNVIHVTRNGGKNWSSLTAPADYVHKVGFGMGGVICAEGSLVPPDGLGAVPHWAFLPRFTFTTQDGNGWSRRMTYTTLGPLGGEMVLPEGHGRLVWVHNQAYKGPPSKAIYLVRGLDSPPIFVTSDAGYGNDHVPSFTPSKDGRTITVRKEGQTFLFDVEKGERRPFNGDPNAPAP